jgi:hypothetical protein
MIQKEVWVWLLVNFGRKNKMNEIKRMQQLAGLITESTFDSIKQRLLSFGYPEDKVQTYCNDLESYGDDDGYDGISDEELKDDFETYSGEINEMPRKFDYGNIPRDTKGKEIKGQYVLNPNYDEATARQIIQDTINQMNVYPASKSNIENALDNSRSKKGLYFWFVSEEGADFIDQITVNKPYITKFNIQNVINNTCITKTGPNGSTYYLVYIGNAGAKNTSKGNKNDFDRLLQHLTGKSKNNSGSSFADKFWNKQFAPQYTQPTHAKRYEQWILDNMLIGFAAWDIDEFDNINRKQRDELFKNDPGFKQRVMNIASDIATDEVFLFTFCKTRMNDPSK